MDTQLSAVTVDIAQSYISCELATFAKDGTPIAWPVTALFQPDDQTLLVSTTIGYPQKAFNVRRDARVSVLYSDPTGSGHDGGVQVLLQGSAECTDEVETGFAGRAAYWRRLLAIQPPAATNLASTAIGRRLMDAYFMRLYITVTPRVETVTATPAVSAAATTSARGRPTGPYARTVHALSQYDSAVLVAHGSSGYATLGRVSPSAAGDRVSLTLPLDADADVVEGRASILCHRHDDHLARQSSFVATGSIRRYGSGWQFVPQRFIPGSSPGVLAQLRALRGLRTKAAGYLARRGLDRPVVVWNELAEIHRSL